MVCRANLELTVLIFGGEMRLIGLINIDMDATLTDCCERYQTRKNYVTLASSVLIVAARKCRLFVAFWLR